jgi:glycosyltransferase involved in cell wall biosynthesis
VAAQAGRAVFESPILESTMNPHIPLPLVSVVTVVRNDARHIAATLESVLGQAYPHLDYIVIDGASLDGTAGIVERCRSRLAAFVSEPDLGLYDAMNKGLALCRRDSYVVFLNSGDVFAGPEALTRMFGSRARWPALVLAPVVRRGARDDLLPVRLGRRLGMPACHQGMFCSQALLARHGFDLRYTLAADFDLYLKVARDLAPPDIAAVDTPVAIVSAGGLSERGTRQVTREYCAIMWRARRWKELAVYAARRSLRHALEGGPARLR